MKILIAGGRNFHMNVKAVEFLDELHEKYNFEELVNGVANGIDKDARYWAMDHNIPIKEFPARWDDIDDCLPKYIKTNQYGKKYNSKAGPDRNLDMIIEMQWEPNNIVVVFPGGNGTRDLFERAKEFGLTIINLMDRKDYISD